MTGNGGDAPETSLVKLPRSSYSELIKIIMAYSKVGKPASLDDISHRCGVSKFVISANNAFLSDIGIIEGGKAKMATDLGLALGRALEHDQTEDISKAWREIVDRSPFFEKIISAVKIRRYFEVSTFESHIAYSSGEPKSPQIMTGARTIVDILKLAGVITESDGKVALAPTPQAVPVSLRSTQDETPAPTVSSEVASLSTQIGRVSLVINININVGAESIEGLAAKIRTMIRDIEKTEEPEAPGSV